MGSEGNGDAPNSPSRERFTVNWYVYNQAGKHVGSFKSKADGEEWARAQMRQWRQSGAPRVPQYSIHYNGSAGTPAEPIAETQEVQP